MKIHFRSYIYDVYIINFCRPYTRVFYFFVQKEGHHLAASLLISLCQEHFICPICDKCTALVVCPYMRIFPLLNRSDVFLAPRTRRQKNSVSNSKTTIYFPVLYSSLSPIVASPRKTGYIVAFPPGEI